MFCATALICAAISTSVEEVSSEEAACDSAPRWMDEADAEISSAEIATCCEASRSRERSSRSVVTIRTNARPKASESPRSAGVVRRSPSARLSAAWTISRR